MTRRRLEPPPAPPRPLAAHEVLAWVLGRPPAIEGPAVADATGEMAVEGSRPLRKMTFSKISKHA